MKILMALMGLEIGGAETHVIELTKELVKRGNEVLVVSNGGVYEERLKEYGVLHVWAPLHSRDPKCMLKSLGIMDQVIRKEKPDLVHAHARIPGFLCGILQRKLKFPFITSAHWVFEVTPLLRLMTNWGQRSVAVSEDIKQYLMESYGYPEDRIHVTINGIDTEVYSPGSGDEALRKELGLGQDAIVGTVSRLDESREEAARQLIALTPELAEKVPGVQILIVGGGNCEEALRQEAEAVNRSLGRNAVVMTGARTDVDRLVALSDVFVGVSRAALEAMAAEKPTILAGNEGYIGIMTRDKLDAARESNFCCRGFSGIDRNKLLTDVVDLLQSPMEYRQEIGKLGRQVILREYSVAKMTDDYVEAYHQLLQKPVNAVISGYYGYGNLGDDAILVAISRQLRERKLPVKLTVLSRQPEETEKDYGLQAVNRFHPLAVFKAIQKADILISGGGSLIQDKTSTRSLLYYLTVIRCAKLLRKPVFLFANGIGPVDRKKNCNRVRKTLKDCDMITLRDAESLETLKALGLDSPDIHVTSDPVFTLSGEENGQELLAYNGIPGENGFVGVSVRRMANAEHFVKEFSAFCDKLVQRGKTVVFFVMQESEDMEFSEMIRQMMTEPSYLIKTPGKPEKMLSMIREMDLLVSMRLHTIIFATIEGVPGLGFDYDPKISALLHTLNMPSCGVPEEFCADRALSIVDDMLEHREELCSGIQEKVAELKPSALETMDRLEKLLREKGLV